MNKSVELEAKMSLIEGHFATEMQGFASRLFCGRPSGPPPPYGGKLHPALSSPLCHYVTWSVGGLAN